MADLGHAELRGDAEKVSDAHTLQSEKANRRREARGAGEILRLQRRSRWFFSGNMGEKCGAASALGIQVGRARQANAGSRPTGPWNTAASPKTDKSGESRPGRGRVTAEHGENNKRIGDKLPYDGNQIMDHSQHI